MNELVEQFLIECRELVEAATADLLALEASPQDLGRLDGAFRGFHTLKGAAGIVGFSAMGRALHAAESLLDSIRRGHRPVSARLISDCLACLDQVVRWLEQTEAKGDVPELPDTDADALVARLSQPDHTPSAADTAPAGASTAWLDLLLARHAAELAGARTAIRYIPDTDGFFRGDDPLARVAALPGILALELAPAEPWRSLADVSPFECNLVITALLAGQPQEVAAALQPVAGQVEIRPVIAGITASPDLSPTARAILQEQLLVAADEAAEGFAGRVGSAARVAANVLYRAGRMEAPAVLHEALAESQRDGNATAFVTALQALLRPTEQQSPVPAAVASQTGAAPTSAPPADAPTTTHPTAWDDAAARAQTVRVLRVNADRIDALVNLTGELVIARNAIGHTARLGADAADPAGMQRRLKDQYALLDRLVGELQRSVLAIRVLPMRHVFQHFPRLVREMAQDLNKSVRLAVEGQTTEADKATVEALFEPLLHVLRNALDHGVEPVEQRLAAGKATEATVQLRATRDGDQVIVEVNDDGRGIDAAKIRQRAAQIGLASDAVLAAMTDQAVIELIFSPGFSTSAAVTSLSGRGVGMDAVRTAVTRLGGRVSVTSQPGAGTNVRFTLPFTVMMLRVMTVSVGGQSFGIPIDSVVETTKVPRGHIRRLGAADVIVLRDRTVPLIPLADVLGLPPRAEPAADAARVVVVQVLGEDDAEQTAALEVDALGERMDVMLKPMEGLLAGVKGYAGTTLLGDGQVLIVLDLQELLR